MLSSSLGLLLLLPYVVSASGIHKLKLKKLPQVASNQHLESAYLAEKYGAQAPAQMPLAGSADAAGRMRFSRPGQSDDDLFWTQEESIIANGGHGVPLTSEYSTALVAYRVRVIPSC